MATGGHSEACCTLPPIVESNYSSKGTYEQIDGIKTYVTGPADATKAIVLIFDIFGFFDQTIQGADILAYSNDNQKYRVYMPDWFSGDPAPIDWFPPDTEEKKKNLGAFFEKNPPPATAKKLPGFVKALKEKDTSVQKLAVLGYCWGSKVICLTVKESSNPFDVASAVHPAMLDPQDAKGIKIPMIVLASKDESEDDVKKFVENLEGPKFSETFKDQIHGWMAARSDLKDSNVKKEYERGYKLLLEFYSKHL